jgi:hypothetical protein
MSVDVINLIMGIAFLAVWVMAGRILIRHSRDSNHGHAHGHHRW